MPEKFIEIVVPATGMIAKVAESSYNKVYKDLGYLRREDYEQQQAAEKKAAKAKKAVEKTTDEDIPSDTVPSET